MGNLFDIKIEALARTEEPQSTKRKDQEQCMY